MPCRQSWRVYAFGIWRPCFGVHALFFAALKLGAAGRGDADQLSLAPADRAVFQACCRAERLKAIPRAGAAIGFFSGVAVPLWRGRSERISQQYCLGLSLRDRFGPVRGPAIRSCLAAFCRVPPSGHGFLPRRRLPGGREPSSPRDHVWVADHLQVGLPLAVALGLWPGRRRRIERMGYITHTTRRHTHPPTPINRHSGCKHGGHPIFWASLPTLGPRWSSILTLTLAGFAQTSLNCGPPAR